MNAVSNKWVVFWLGAVCAAVFAMVVVGGATRLTGSGLSMVDWKPIMGIVPPMNEVEWNEAFEAYKQYPEFQEVNAFMDLHGFKQIFYWEYAHRVLGRLIGILFFVPLVVLWAMGRIPSRYKLPLLIGLVLGGMQGLLGWYMVKSGLIDVPRVSHYRLAAHLSLAMFILCYLFWLMLAIGGVHRGAVSGGVRWLLFALAGAIVLQIVLGAFTAGMHAGFGYNTWPLMNGQFMADAVFFMDPLWLNFFESGPTVQFLHRWLAAAVVGMAFVLWVLARRESQQVKWAAALLLGALLVQFGIGVATLVHVVPVTLGTIHQGWACVVLVALVYFLYASGPTQVTVAATDESLPGANQYDAG